jgi:hypothetical protein
MFESLRRGRMRGTRSLSAAISLLAISLAAAPAAFAKPEPGRLAGTISGGVDFPVSGKVHSGVNAPVANLGTLNPALAGTAGELRIEKRSHNRIYKESYNAALDLSYGLSEQSEVFGSVRHTRSGAGTVQVGNVFVPSTSATLPINGTFSKYRSTAFEAGYRHYLGAGTIQPYGALRAGVARTGSINASFAVPAANIAINNARFYKRSTSFSGGLDVGLSYDVGANVALQAETGVRYTSKLKGDDTDIAALGLSSINNSGDRLSVPITVKLRVGF